MGAAAKRDRQPGAADGEVAYAASHDLRAPIVAIGQLVESIQLDFDGVLPEEVVRRLSLIRARANRCDDLLRRLNRYWRAGDTSQAVAPLDLAEMVADIARHLAPPPGAGP
jgi:light-regulated signal transduction histidine kinase (bacteriophytochrome)